jgi:hypothetical protein
MAKCWQRDFKLFTQLGQLGTLCQFNCISMCNDGLCARSLNILWGQGTRVSPRAERRKLLYLVLSTVILSAIQPYTQPAGVFDHGIPQLPHLPLDKNRGYNIPAVFGVLPRKWHCLLTRIIILFNYTGPKHHAIILCFFSLSGIEFSVSLCTLNGTSVIWRLNQRSSKCCSFFIHYLGLQQIIFTLTLLCPWLTFPDAEMVWYTYLWGDMILEQMGALHLLCSNPKRRTLPSKGKKLHERPSQCFNHTVWFCKTRPNIWLLCQTDGVYRHSPF